MENGSFVAVLPESEKNCRLVLKGGEGTVWKYFLNWSIARFVDGRFVSLQLEDAKWEDGKLALGLDAGQYRILTSNRLPNGNIFANRYYVDIAAVSYTHLLRFPAYDAPSRRQSRKGSGARIWKN